MTVPIDRLLGNLTGSFVPTEVSGKKYQTFTFSDSTFAAGIKSPPSRPLQARDFEQLTESDFEELSSSDEDSELDLAGPPPPKRRRLDNQTSDPLDICNRVCQICQQHLPPKSLGIHFHARHPDVHNPYKCPEKVCPFHLEGFAEIQPLKRHYESRHLPPPSRLYAL